MFFADHLIEEITEAEQFPTFFNFLNTLGGAMALWLGVTLVAVFEIIEWLIRMLIALLYCKKRKYAATAQEDELNNRPV